MNYLSTSITESLRRPSGRSVSETRQGLNVSGFASLYPTYNTI